jgi:hypothetical protein
MKWLFLFVLLMGLVIQAPAQVRIKKPTSACGEPTSMYTRGAAPTSGSPLPKFTTQPVREYKVQVALLRNTTPEDFPFHESLVARWRPCEEAWVVESRQSFASRQEAVRLRERLRRMGYSGAFLVELVGYQ